MMILIFVLKKMYMLPSKYFRAKIISIIGKLEGGQAFSTTIRALMQEYHGIKIGIGTYGPCFNLDQTWVGNGNLSVGNYTSIAKGVCIYTRNHPHDRPSTSPLFYSALFTKNSVKEDEIEYGKLEIGNDVWIGQYAVILPSCHYIGNGAVIGAGCIVTRDVPSYAIVVGNPGKILKYRFDKDTIIKIEATKWWESQPKELLSKYEQFQSIANFFDDEYNK